LDKREDRALHVARLDQKIKSEILERLKKGTYGDIYNFDQKQFDSILDDVELPLEEENEIEDEFIGEVDNENDYSLDEDNPFGVNEEDLNNYLDDEGDGNQEDYFQPNDIDELDKLFSSYSEKDLKPSNNNNTNDKGNKKKGYIEIEMEKEDQEEYIKK